VINGVAVVTGGVTVVVGGVLTSDQWLDFKLQYEINMIKYYKMIFARQ
jgi:hypothetical protein